MYITEIIYCVNIESNKTENNEQKKRKRSKINIKINNPIHNLEKMRNGSSIAEKIIIIYMMPTPHEHIYTHTHTHSIRRRNKIQLKFTFIKISTQNSKTFPSNFLRVFHKQFSLYNFSFFFKRFFW